MLNKTVGKALVFVCMLIVGMVDTSFSQKIAINFLDTLSRNYEIMVTDLDGKSSKNITNNPATDWTYYAYKDKLYFVSDRDTCKRCFFLYSCNSEGNNLKKVSNLMLEDSWMSSRHQGTEMVVSGRGSGSRNQLYLMNLTTGSYRRLTYDTAAYYNDPTFVNEGKQIAFRYKKEKRNRNMKTEIWLMNADGSSPRQLTFYPPADSSAPWYAYHAGAPKWNAAGRFISFQSMQQGKYHIYGITPDGKKQWQITGTGMNAGWHSWSADGKRLVFDTFNDDQSAFDIKYLNLKTGKQFFITQGGFKLEYGPVFLDR